MPSRDDSTDAVHIRFREKGEPSRYFCNNCSETFNASQILDVFEHYAKKIHHRYHCNCLYCDGKVYQYHDGEHRIQYYHNCFRWKENLDK